MYIEHKMYFYLMVQVILDNVLVKVESEVNNTRNGLYIPDGFLPSGPPPSKVTTGIVVGVPLGMYEYSEIVPEVQVGDRVYFHYNAISEMSRVLLEYSQDYDHSIPYSMIFCAVRNGEIIMIGSRVLCEKYYDPDITFEEINGVVIPVKKSKSGIIMEMNVKHNPHKAVLRHIGNPLRGQKRVDARPGDLVYYEKDADFENTIEGREYLCMKQENLLAIYE